MSQVVTVMRSVTDRIVAITPSADVVFRLTDSHFFAPPTRAARAGRAREDARTHRDRCDARGVRHVVCSATAPLAQHRSASARVKSAGPFVLRGGDLALATGVRYTPATDLIGVCLRRGGPRTAPPTLGDPSPAGGRHPTPP